MPLISAWLVVSTGTITPSLGLSLTESATSGKPLSAIFWGGYSVGSEPEKQVKQIK